MASPSETVALSQLHARLRALGAVYQRDTSNARRHIYYSGASKRYIKVKRHPSSPNTHVVLSYHRECPCIYED